MLDLVRRRRLSEDLSLVWLVSTLVIAALGFWTELLQGVTHALGILYESSTVFAVGLGFAVLGLLVLSVRLSRLAFTQASMIQGRSGLPVALCASAIAGAHSMRARRGTRRHVADAQRVQGPAARASPVAPYSRLSRSFFAALGIGAGRRGWPEGLRGLRMPRARVGRYPMASIRPSTSQDLDQH